MFFHALIDLYRLSVVFYCGACVFGVELRVQGRENACWSLKGGWRLFPRPIWVRGNSIDIGAEKAI